jgi:hypothetical protein
MTLDELLLGEIMTAQDIQDAMTAQGYTTDRAALLTDINAKTDKLTFDASNNVLSSPQTAMTLAASQHVIVDSGTVTSVTDPVTVGTNNDKSGYSFNGTSAGAGATASVTTADIAANVFKNGTVTLYARVYKDGNDIQQANISTIAYNLYLLDDGDKNSRTAVAGHTGVSLTAANVIFDAVQSDYEASNYNFKHTPPISEYPAFTIAGRYYLAEYMIVPISGEIIIVRFKVNVL